MKASDGFDVVDQVQTEGALVEVVQYSKLHGSSDIRTAESLFFANQAGIRLKMVRIVLENSFIRVEPGALYYMRGRLEMRSSTGGGMMKALKRKLTSGESFLVNEIH